MTLTQYSQWPSLDYSCARPWQIIVLAIIVFNIYGIVGNVAIHPIAIIAAIVAAIAIAIVALWLTLLHFGCHYFFVVDVISLWLTLLLCD